MPTQESNFPYVFINCPYDKRYWQFLDAICFTLQMCGFMPRSALEFTDSSTARMAKIFQLIGTCKFSIHELSRVELDSSTELPRFNMPFELGVFLGAKQFGDEAHRHKTCVVLESDEHRYRAFLSDMAGYDIQFHKGDLGHLMTCVRNYLRGIDAEDREAVPIPGASEIILKYAEYRRDLPETARNLQTADGDLHFLDRRYVIFQWLRGAQARQ